LKNRTNGVVKDMVNPFFTIGHSTRSVDDFVDLLRQAEIRLIVDVRAIARSRSNPQYNGDALPEALAARQICYAHIPALGGFRGQLRHTSPAINAFWDNQRFHNYADYAMTDAFRTGLAELRHLGHSFRCSVMCAEAVWWRCHRRIIADYLIASGETVFHILRAGHIEQAQPTGAARPGPEGALVYPADV
jgi:uncharacterized protein (DUF488 family)